MRATQAVMLPLCRCVDESLLSSVAYYPEMGIVNLSNLTFFATHTK